MIRPDELFAALKGRGRPDDFMAVCPAHKDRTPSLHVTSRDGTVLLHCHAGCSQDSVLEALRARGLWPQGRANGHYRPPSSTATQSIAVLPPDQLSNPPVLLPPTRDVDHVKHYRREVMASANVAHEFVYSVGGESVLIKQRMSAGERKFIQHWRVADEHGELWQNLAPKGFKRIPYTAPGKSPFAERDAVGSLFWCEGERDVDTLANLGLDAFTFGGASDVPAGAELYVKGRKVVIVADNDDAGERSAERKADACRGQAVSIRTIRFPELPRGGDVTDYLAAGHTREDLRKLVEASPFEPDDAAEDTGAEAPTPNGATPQSGSDDWPEPDWSLLDDRRGNLPAFPLETLPGAVHDWMKRAARGSGTTIAHVAVPLLAIASGLLGTARRVQPSRSWSEPATLWGAIVGFSGTGKTPGLDRTRSVVGEIEYQRRSKVAELQRQHESREQAAKALKRKWEKEVQEAVEGGQPAPPKPNAAMDVGQFVAPRLCVSDTTVERLTVLLEARPRGMMLVADELSRLFLNMSRYTNGGQDNEFWLEAWNGKHYTVERQGRPAVVLSHLLVGVVGGFQPDKLAKSFEGEADGMYARILFAWPDEAGYQPLTNEVAEIEPEIQNALTRIIDLPAEGEDGALVPKSIPLTPGAVASFEQFRQFLHQGKGDFDGREREWWAKGSAHVLRLALTLTYIEWGMLGGAEPIAIETKHLDAAVQLWKEYFWPHSRAAIRQIGLTERHAYVRRALRWIRKHRKSEISQEEIRRDALGQKIDASQTRTLMDSLVQAGWLREVTEKTGGRDRHRWKVNPDLAAQTAETAEIPPVPSASHPLRSSRSFRNGEPYEMAGNDAAPLGPPGDSPDGFDG